MDSFSNSPRSSFEDERETEFEQEFVQVSHGKKHTEKLIEKDDTQSQPRKLSSSETLPLIQDVFVDNPVFNELKELLEYCIISQKEYDRQVKILLENLETKELQKEEEPSKKEEPEEIELSRYEEFQNKDGTFTTKTYTTNAEGQKILITRIVKRTKVQRKVPKRVIERRNLIKFGRCAGQPAGPEEGVTQMGDLVHLEAPKASDQKEEKKPTFNTVSAIKCRNCNEFGHWTKDCPHPRDALELTRKISESISEQSESETESQQDETKGSYVPPHLRKSSRSTEHQYDDDDDEIKSLRVTNLDFDATDRDLKELFEHIGRVRKAHVAKDRNTKESRGMGYVDMYSKEDCEEAIKRLNGHPYGQLILRVELVKPKKR